MKQMLRSKQIIPSVMLVLIILGYVIFMVHKLTPGEVHFSFTFERNCEKGGTVLKAFDSEHCLMKNNIFFIETSHAKQLNVRQACSIESAARHNPSYEIKVLLTSTEPIETLMKKLATISNVKVIRVDMRDVVRGTPLSVWYASEVWKKSKYKVVHLSDALRLILLWKYGGVYLDMDTVVLRSMEKLRNTTIFESGVLIGNAIMLFDKGHPFVKKCIIDFATKYDPWSFSMNGPVLITRNMKRYCHTDDLFEIYRANCGIDVLPMDRGFPIPYEYWKMYFSPRTKYTPDFSKSYLIHVWNKFSAAEKLAIGTDSVYEIAMKNNCPIVYEYAKQMIFVKVVDSI